MEGVKRPKLRPCPACGLAIKSSFNGKRREFCGRLKCMVKRARMVVVR